MVKRCFFNLVDEQGSIIDQDGVEVTATDELRAQVAKAIEEFRQTNASATRDLKGWRLEVTDTSGAVLLTVKLDHPVSP
jgi:hypothetical protein